MDAAIRKIVSGGQTGADRAALDFAIAHGIEHGGWCPAGRKAEDGPIDARYALTETEGGYARRTRLNVRDSDGTLVLNLGELADGTLSTVNHARRMKRPCLVAQLDAGLSEGLLQNIWRWLSENAIEVLNVAGPRESKRPGIYGLTFACLERLGLSPDADQRGGDAGRPRRGSI
ncbi:MAG: putative molybdenum carrier protein [Pseudomonadota bacterium]